MYKLWNPSDVVTLIAWLDFCVENGVDFYDTICERLSETRKEDASREFNFTGRQVYDKLNDLARRNHQPNPNSHYPSPTEIKERGSVCFPGLQDPIRKDVQALKQIYRIQYAGPLQHEQSTGDRQVQGVTSAQISQVGPGVNKKGTPGKRVPNSRRNTQHVTGTRPPREDQGTATLTPNRPSPHVSRNPLPRDGQERATQTRPSIQVVNAPSYLAENRRISGISLSPVANVRRDVLEPCGELPGSAESHIRQEWENILKGLKQQGNDENIYRDLEARRLATLRRKEVEELRAEKAILEKKNEMLVTDNRLLKNARLAREAAGNDPLESDLYRQHCQISALRQRKHEMEQEVGFFKEIPEQTRSLSAEHVDEAMEEIGRELESMLEGTEPGRRLVITGPEPNSDLASLIHSGLGLGSRTMTESPPNAGQTISELEPQLIIRSLALAALRDWVFYSSFPGSAPDGSLCSLLRFQRDVIMDFAGWRSLRGLEAAAYRRMITSTEFQEDILARRATELSYRLLQALWPLLFGPIDGGERRAFDSPEESFEVYKGLYFRFQEVFKLGLKFKSMTVLSDDQYQFIIHPPDTSSPKDAMEESQTTLSQSSRVERNENFGSWLHATMKVVGPRPSEPLDRQIGAIVQPLNFIGVDSELETRVCRHSKDIVIAKAEIEDEVLTPQKDSMTQSRMLKSRAQQKSPSRSQPLSPTVSTSSVPIVGQAIDQPRPRNAEQNLVESDISEGTGTVHSEAIARRPKPNIQKGANEAGPDNDDSSLSGAISIEDPDETEDDINITLDRKTPSLTEEVNRMNSAEIHECSYCGTQFAHKHNLIRHERFKTCTRCIECGSKFHKGADLIFHRKSEHSHNPETLPAATKLSNGQAKPASRVDRRKHDTQNAVLPRERDLRGHQAREQNVPCHEATSINGSLEHGAHPGQTSLTDATQLTVLSGNNSVDHTMQPGMDENAVVKSSETPAHQNHHQQSDFEADIETEKSHSNTAHCTRSLSASLSQNLSDGWRCQACNKIFRSEYSLEGHMTCHKKRAQGQQNEEGLSKRAKIEHNEKSGSEEGEWVAENRAVRETASIEPTMKRSDSRALPRTQRETTPNSRHVARIIALVSKVDAESFTRKEPKQSTKTETPRNSTSNGDRRLRDDKTGTEGGHIRTDQRSKPKAATLDQAKVRKALPGYGKKTAATTRPTSNYSVVVPSAPWKHS